MHGMKQQLYRLCKEHITKGMAAARQAIYDARDAAANETKSSAGDKYETAREMMQQDIDLNTSRLAELQKLKAALDLISPDHQSEKITAGSLAYTTAGNYYLSISIGKLIVDGISYYCLSAASPLGSKLMGLGKGDVLFFNSKEINIDRMI